MTTKPVEQLVITPETAVTPEIAHLLGMAQEARGRLLNALDGVDEALLDWQPPVGNAIGALLYHLAIIEADWLYAEVLESDFPADVLALFPADVRDAAGHLAVVTGEPLAAHLRRLAAIRARLLATYETMTLADFRRPRHLPHYDVTPAWVLHHLMQHEAEHRGQILVNRELWAQAA